LSVGPDRIAHMFDVGGAGAGGAVKAPLDAPALTELILRLALHIDHAIPDAEGGSTSEVNGQGLCAQCNYARQAPGWTALPREGPRHTLTITTPTGHTHISTAPRPPGTGPPTRTIRRAA
jgi:hypothetical protein